MGMADGLEAKGRGRWMEAFAENNKVMYDAIVTLHGMSKEDE